MDGVLELLRIPTGPVINRPRARQGAAAARRTGRWALAALAASIALAALCAAPARAVVSHELGGGYGSVHHFWTKERMREAKPMRAPALPPPAPADRSALSAASGGEEHDGKPTYLAGSAPTRGPLAQAARHRRKHKHKHHNVPRHPKVKSGPVPPALYTRAPFRSSGKLYMQFPDGLYSCSATVVHSKTHSTILTAGHCVYNKGQGFATQIAFVPGYFAGRAPHGFWVGAKTVTNAQWVKHRNQKYDYAAIRVGGPQGPVGKVVGESGVALNAGRHHHEVTLGYPNNLGGTNILWACLSKLIGDDPYDRDPGRKNIAIACNMSHGCSGGGWQFGRHGHWYVNSVSSYFYKTKRFRHILFGPYLTDRARKVISKAQRG